MITDCNVQNTRIIPAHTTAVHCYAAEGQRRPTISDMITETYDVIGFHVMGFVTMPIIAGEMTPYLADRLAVVQPDGRCVMGRDTHKSIVEYRSAMLEDAQKRWDRLHIT